MAVTRTRGRRRKKLLDDRKYRRGHSHLNEKALDRTMWRNRFGRSFGPVVRQNTEWMILMCLLIGRKINIKYLSLIASLIWCIRNCKTLCNNDTTYCWMLLLSASYVPNYLDRSTCMHKTQGQSCFIRRYALYKTSVTLTNWHRFNFYSGETRFDWWPSHQLN
jgi:hypothetical protein